MKKLIAVALLCAAGSAWVVADEVQDYSAEARGLIQEFGGSLKAKLQAAMKEGGPTNAIGVCNTEAPGIAKEVSEKSGWSVARTSLKLRNPGNRPDEWELAVLKQFEDRKAQGEDVTKMDYAEVVEEDGQRTFRYMKAIPTGAVCLNCHGAQVSDEVKAKLSDLYPTDEATGFKEGDIRGAFTLAKPL